MEVPQTPLRFLERTAQVYEKREAVKCGSVRLTWGEHAARARKASQMLTELGVTEGETVAYLGLNCHRLLELYYAVPGVGGVLLPLNVRLSPQDLAFILEDSGAKWLFVGPPVAPLAVAALALVNRPIALIWAGPDPAPPQLDVPTYEASIGKADDAPFPWSGEETAVAELFYTSGTTGRPKGVMLTHRNLYAHALSVLLIAGYDDTTVMLHTLPLFHVNGWGTPHTIAAVGGRHVVMSHFEPKAALLHLLNDEVTDCYLVPTMGVALLEAARNMNRRPPRLRQILLGGAAAPPSLVAQIEEVLGGEVLAGYGLSETTPVVCVARVKPEMQTMPFAERLHRKASAGLPIPGVEVRVANDAMEPVPRDGTTNGELLVRGDVVMKGYWHRDEETAEAMRGGWLHTGDVAVWDEEGYVRIVDRAKDLVISGGENISSVEVENAFYTHAGVLECAVVAQPDSYWGEVPHAFVVLREHANVNEAELLGHVRLGLAHFKVPKHVTFVDALPKTGTGKIQKNLLRDRLTESACGA